MRGGENACGVLSINGKAAHLKMELFNDIHGDPRARLCQVQACNQG